MKARLAAMEAEAAKLREVGVLPPEMDPLRPTLAGLATFMISTLPRERLHACCIMTTASRSETWWCCVLHADWASQRHQSILCLRGVMQRDAAGSREGQRSGG